MVHDATQTVSIGLIIANTSVSGVSDYLDSFPLLSKPIIYKLFTYLQSESVVPGPTISPFRVSSEALLSTANGHGNNSLALQVPFSTRQIFIRPQHREAAEFACYPFVCQIDLIIICNKKVPSSEFCRTAAPDSRLRIF